MFDIFCTISMVGFTLWYIQLQYGLDVLMNKLRTTSLNEWLVELLWNTSYTVTLVKYRFGKLYDTFPLVRSFTDNVIEKMNYYNLRNTKNAARSYPNGSITRLVDEGDGELSIIEDFFDFSDFEWSDRSIDEKLLKMKILAKNLLVTDETVIECLVILSLSPDVTISRLITKDMGTLYDTENCELIEPSSVKFLSIDYSHPDMDDTTELVIDKSYFMVGNHIISSVFIGRLLLQDESARCVFNNKYSICIIDKQVNTVNCGYKDFIEIIDSKQYLLHKHSTEISEKGTVLPTVNADAESVAHTPAVDTEDDESKSWDKINKDD